MQSNEGRRAIWQLNSKQSGEIIDTGINGFNPITDNTIRKNVLMDNTWIFFSDKY